jgi:micrococcal nuclease
MPALSWGWQGKVVHLDDGDSGSALYRGRPVKFRLYGIDAPELHQDFGRKARSFCSKLLFHRVVEIEPLDRDPYEREVALVFVDGKCVNEEMVKAGFAWVYLRYCRNSRCAGWLRLQEEAREKRLGLWVRRNPVPPWVFRERERTDHALPRHGLLTGCPADFFGNDSFHVFHRRGCRYYDCRRWTFHSLSPEEANREGYTPCRICKPGKLGDLERKPKVTIDSGRLDWTKQ